MIETRHLEHVAISSKNIFSVKTPSDDTANTWFNCCGERFRVVTCFSKCYRDSAPIAE